MVRLHGLVAGSDPVMWADRVELVGGAWVPVGVIEVRP